MSRYLHNGKDISKRKAIALITGQPLAKINLKIRGMNNIRFYQSGPYEWTFEKIGNRRKKQAISGPLYSGSITILESGDTITTGVIRQIDLTGHRSN